MQLLWETDPLPCWPHRPKVPSVRWGWMSEDHVPVPSSRTSGIAWLQCVHGNRPAFMGRRDLGLCAVHGVSPLHRGMWLGLGAGLRPGCISGQGLHSLWGPRWWLPVRDHWGAVTHSQKRLEKSPHATPAAISQLSKRNRFHLGSFYIPHFHPVLQHSLQDPIQGPCRCQPHGPGARAGGAVGCMGLWAHSAACAQLGASAGERALI